MSCSLRLQLPFVLLLAVLTACSGGGDQTTPISTPANSPSPVTEPTLPPEQPRLRAMRSYIFGHSLIVHEPPSIPTPSDETSVPHWMVQLAEAAEFTYAIDGQYGFLRQHAEFPPRAQWRFDLAPSVWNSDNALRFAEANYNTVLITAANFIQYQGAERPYDGDNPNRTTPLAETLKIIDWVQSEAPSAKIYIYENWPNMDGRIRSFPPTSRELAAYHAHTLSGFHSWWLDYHDALQSARPNADIRMIPVGPILATLLSSAPLNSIPVGELYEDDAPHGRPTLYFLAAMISFSATFAAPLPQTFTVPNTVHSSVRDNYADIADIIWRELGQFQNGDGTSRVW